MGAPLAEVRPSDDLLGPLFDALPVGLIVLDVEGRVVLYNAHEERMAGRKRRSVIGRRFFEEIAPCLDVRGLAAKFHAQVRSGTLDESMEVSFPFPHAQREVQINLRSFVVNGVPHGMMILRDVTPERGLERLRETLAQLLVHDMKSPLANIMANLQFVQEELVTKDAASSVDAIADSVAGARRLDRMVRNLLDISRLETGAFPLAKASCDVTAVAEDALRAVRGAARDRGVDVVLEAKPQPANVDAPVVERMLVNLLENAITHSPSGGEVIVRVYVEAAKLVLEVSDQGPGIPAALRSGIFEKFAQAADERHLSNHGLGLTFVRMAARAHGGEATAHPGKQNGSLFRIELPR